MQRRSFSRLTALALAVPTLGCGGPAGPHVNDPPSRQPVQVSRIPRTPPPPIHGVSAIVIDADSGAVLYAKNADSIRPVASTQKILTALTVIDDGSIDRQVTVTTDDTRCEPTKLYIRPGETYSRRQLMQALMIKSGNDVARALARDVGGSQEGFAAMMNRKARSLGMRRSNFVNPNGLPAEGQYSTARDIAIASREAYRSPLIRSWTSTKAYTFRFDSGRSRRLENTNKLLKRVPYCDGLKTGTTNAAGRCLVSSGTLNGRSAIAVVLKSNSRHIWDDSEKLLRWALETPWR